jgi:hypothetical protein
MSQAASTAAPTEGKPVDNSFTLTDNRTGKSYKLPVLKGTIGPDVIDVRKLYSDTDCPVASGLLH